MDVVDRVRVAVLVDGDLRVWGGQRYVVDGAAWWKMIYPSESTIKSQKNQKKKKSKEKKETIAIEIGLAWCSGLGFVEEGGSDVE